MRILPLLLLSACFLVPLAQSWGAHKDGDQESHGENGARNDDTFLTIATEADGAPRRSTTRGTGAQGNGYRGAETRRPAFDPTAKGNSDNTAAERRGERETEGKGERARETEGKGERETERVAEGKGERETEGKGERETEGKGERVTDGKGERETEGKGERETEGKGEREADRTTTPDANEGKGEREADRTTTPDADDGKGEREADRTTMPDATDGKGERETDGKGERETDGKGEREADRTTTPEVDDGKGERERDNAVEVDPSKVDPREVEDMKRRQDEESREADDKDAKGKSEAEEAKEKETKEKEEDSLVKAACKETDVEACAIFYRSNADASFVFHAKGNPLLAPGSVGSCCSSKPAAEVPVPCGDCCDFKCSEGFSLKSPAPLNIGRPPSNELCCVKVEDDDDSKPVDVIITVDYSWSVLRYPVHLAEEIAFVSKIVGQLLSPSQKGKFRVGVVGFSAKVAWKSKLTDDPSKFSLAGGVTADDMLRNPARHDPKNLFLRAADMAIGSNGGYPTFTELAVMAAHEELKSERARPGARKVLLLMTDGAPWPQAVHDSGPYKNSPNQVSKAIAAIRRLKNDNIGTVYVSIFTEDPRQYPRFSTTDRESGVLSFSWKHGGDANKIMSLCTFSSTYCDECVEKYGAIYLDSDDGITKNNQDVLKFTLDTSTTPFPLSLSDDRVTRGFMPPTNYGINRIKYKRVLPSEGMTRYQYTDMCWRRMQGKWENLNRNKNDAELYEATQVAIMDWKVLSERMHLLVDKTKLAIDVSANQASSFNATNPLTM